MGSSNTGGAKDESPPDGAKAQAARSGSQSPDDAAAAAYVEGEKVLAYHGPAIYEAKVQKSELRKDEWKYFVHYLGWSKKLLFAFRITNFTIWDEWVGTDRLLKVNPENIQKQQALKKHSNADKSAKSGRTTQNKPKGSSVARGKKRKGQSSIEEKETRSPEKAFTIQFPLTLKKQLVDDWEFVTQLGKLVKLPRTPNVDEILKKYLEYRSKKDGMVTESVAEILKGIRCYFDKALLSMLLYKKERQQYHEVVTDNIAPSTIYGAEHLLRLFVKLPELLPYVSMEEEALTKLQQKLLDFLKFLQKNQSLFFLSTYESSMDVDEADEEE